MKHNVALGAAYQRLIADEAGRQWRPVNARKRRRTGDIAGMLVQAPKVRGSRQRTVARSHQGTGAHGNRQLARANTSPKRGSTVCVRQDKKMNEVRDLNANLLKIRVVVPQA